MCAEAQKLGIPLDVAGALLLPENIFEQIHAYLQLGSLDEQRQKAVENFMGMEWFNDPETGTISRRFKRPRESLNVAVTGPTGV